MVDFALLAAMMDSLKDPFVFVDTEHVIRYMNKSAVKKYAKRGGAELIGRSIFDCHKKKSCNEMLEIFAEMQNGLEERLITDSTTRRIYMRAVRDPEGRVIGYYERYEWPWK